MSAPAEAATPSASSSASTTATTQRMSPPAYDDLHSLPRARPPQTHATWGCRGAARARFGRAGNGSLGGVFDHVAIAVADLAASERFYRTVLSVLGAEPSRADAEIVEWDDWDIMATDREHPVPRGLHVGFRAPSQEAV